MKYELVTAPKGQPMKAETFDTLEEFTAALKERGETITGEHRSERTRAELNGQPKISGFCGPMWNGGAIRYESREAYAMLST